ncbi:hypothetical protein MP638_001090 [Amoeboaphelidium occidentale]|nr:hypothetical protein MP638_001090 [Amoeboaphelidium occidentale]
MTGITYSRQWQDIDAKECSSSFLNMDTSHLPSTLNKGCFLWCSIDGTYSLYATHSGIFSTEDLEIKSRPDDDDDEFWISYWKFVGKNLAGQYFRWGSNPVVLFGQFISCFDKVLDSISLKEDPIDSLSIALDLFKKVAKECLQRSDRTENITWNNVLRNIAVKISKKIGKNETESEANIIALMGDYIYKKVRLKNRVDSILREFGQCVEKRMIYDIHDHLNVHQLDLILYLDVCNSCTTLFDVVFFGNSNVQINALSFQRPKKTPMHEGRYGLFNSLLSLGKVAKSFKLIFH